MDEQFSTQKLLELRRLTRGVSELLRNQLKEYLATLAPLFRPAMVLGEYVHGSTKGAVKGAENNFRELRGLFDAIAGSKLYGISRELPLPLDIMSTTLEMIPMEYTYGAKGGPESKTITITSPLKWVLCYSGFQPSRLREFLGSKNRNNSEVTSHVLHHLVLHSVVTKQPGLKTMLDALHFQIISEPTTELGALPITCARASVSTFRPPDEVIIESTEISGMNVFEEVVNLEDIKLLRDPLHDRLVELSERYGARLE